MTTQYGPKSLVEPNNDAIEGAYNSTCEGVENYRLTDALKKIASQKTTGELADAGYIEGDYEDAYDTMIEVARYALSTTKPAKAEEHEK